MLGLISVSLMWGGTAVLVKIALTGVSPLFVTAARVVLSSLILVPAVLWRARRGGPTGLRRSDVRHLLILSIVLVLVPYGLTSWAQQYTSASLAAVLNATIPLWTVAFADVRRRRPPQPRHGTGILVGIVGVCVLVGFDPHDLQRATLFAAAALLACSAARGFGYTYLQRHLIHLPPLLTAAITHTVATATLLPAAVVTGARPDPSIGAVTALVILGVVSTGLAQVVNYHNIARLGPTTAALSTYLIPVVGSVAAVAVLDEPITAHTTAGTAIVLVAIAITYPRKPTPPGKPKPAPMSPSHTATGPTPQRR